MRGNRDYHFYWRLLTVHVLVLSALVIVKTIIRRVVFVGYSDNIPYLHMQIDEDVAAFFVMNVQHHRM